MKARAKGASEKGIKRGGGKSSNLDVRGTISSLEPGILLWRGTGNNFPGMASLIMFTSSHMYILYTIPSTAS